MLNVSYHNMTRLLTILLLFLLTHTFVSAQKKDNDNKISLRKENRNLMRKQIKQLKEGALLVRLQNKGNSIRALNETKQFALAKQIKINQDSYNKKIISAFRNNFNFCPIYFFFSNFSDSILSNHFNGIIFLNDSLQLDTSIKLVNNKFLTAEFAIIEQDTSKYFSNYYYLPCEKGLEKRSAFYGGPDLRFEVLKIMSDQLVQLKRPFPYYVRTFNSLPIIRRKPLKVVMRMNKKLTAYYENNNGS